MYMSYIISILTKDSYQLLKLSHDHSQNISSWVVIIQRGRIREEFLFLLFSTLAAPLEQTPIEWISTVTTQYSSLPASQLVRYISIYDGEIYILSFTAFA